MGRAVLSEDQPKFRKEHIEHLHQLIGGTPASLDLFPPELHEQTQAPVAQFAFVCYVERVLLAYGLPQVQGGGQSAVRLPHRSSSGGRRASHTVVDGLVLHPYHRVTPFSQGVKDGLRVVPPGDLHCTDRLLRPGPGKLKKGQNRLKPSVSAPNENTGDCSQP